MTGSGVEGGELSKDKADVSECHLEESLICQTGDFDGIRKDLSQFPCARK